MTKKLTYSGQFKATLLMDELFAAFPSWIFADPLPGFPDNRKSLLHLESKPDGTEVYLTVPEDADESKIASVITAHDHTKKDANEIAQEKRCANRVTAFAKLKALGLTDEELEAIL